MNVPYEVIEHYLTTLKQWYQEYDVRVNAVLLSARYVSDALSNPIMEAMNIVQMRQAVNDLEQTKERGRTMGFLQRD